MVAKTGVPVEKQQVRTACCNFKDCVSPVHASCPYAPALQLFWHSKELVSELYDHLTLSEMEIHTGFGVSGYDLVRNSIWVTDCRLSQPIPRWQSEDPDYFPPVFRTAQGLMEKSAITNPEFLERHPEASEDPETLAVIPGKPIKQEQKWLESVFVPAKLEVYNGL